MKRGLAHWLTRLYPRNWRKRYGAEFEELLKNSPGDLRTSTNVFWSAVKERIFPIDRTPFTFDFVFRRPSAFLPLAMSLIALTMVLVTLATNYGGARGPAKDEDAVAHLWQLLMAGQMPIILFFAIKWLPRAPRQSFYVLAQQVGAAGASFALVFFLGW